MKKSTRKIKAKETLEIIEKGYYFDENLNTVQLRQERQDAINNTWYFTADELDNLKETITLDRSYDTEITVTNEDSVSAILRLAEEEKEHIMCLNFASAKNPGGGFLNGALAQEETLAVSSALYGCQMNAYAYYETHRGMKSCVYTDGMINSPNVPVFRDRNGNLLSEFVMCSIITASAVNTGVVKRNEKHLTDTIPDIMDVRIDKMLSICVKEKYETLILGAWGCGVFQNDPIMIAELFKKHLNGKFKNQFKKAVFAIYSRDKRFINAFNEFF